MPEPTPTPPVSPSRGMTGSLAILGVATLVRKRLDERLSLIGLSVRHVSVLGHVRAQPGRSMSGLAKRLSITTQSMHATVHDLLGRGLLQADDLTRGRASELKITTQGEEVLEQALAMVAEVDKRVGLDATTTDRLMEVAFRIVGSDERDPRPPNP